MSIYLLLVLYIFTRPFLNTTDSGVLYTLGRGRESQLGNGASKDSDVPVIPLHVSNVVNAACGMNHVLALTGIHRLSQSILFLLSYIVLFM